MSNIFGSGTKFERLKTYYNTNNTKPALNWLDYSYTFSKCGKQGIAGVMTSNEKIENEYIQYCFKISKHLDFLIEHEWYVLSQLSKLNPYCIHFCKSVGTITSGFEFKLNAKTNPYQPNTDKKMTRTVLLSEYIKDSYKFSKYIASKYVESKVIYSIIKQVLVALIIAQHKLKFTHYDLHSCNILIKKCDPNIVFTYVCNGITYVIPTYGSYPIIIDYGFSYADGAKHILAPMAHTEIGFTCDRFDWLADPKLFLITVSKEIKDKRQDKYTNMFRQIVKNMFYPLSVDWSCGWDKNKEKGATELLTKQLRSYKQPSYVFKKNLQYCVDLIQTCIESPLTENQGCYLEQSYEVFTGEFSKIEQQIRDTQSLLYILKSMCISIKKIDDTNVEQASIDFVNDIYTTANEISKFCNFKNINKQVLFLSFKMLINNCEGYLYQFMQHKINNRDMNREKLPVQSIDEIYNIINYNIKHDYVVNDNTIIHVFDADAETSYQMTD